MDPLSLIEEKKMPFAELLGTRILSATPERLTAEMVVREEFCTVPAVLHGGAVMAFADSLGAYATIAQPSRGRDHHDHRVEDQLSRAGSRWHHRHRRVRGGASRPPHDGLADADHQRSGKIAGHRDADPNGARGNRARLTSARHQGSDGPFQREEHPPDDDAS